MKIYSFKKQRGFSILEVLVSVAIFSFILLTITSFIFWMSYSNSKTKADADSLENASRILDIITYEIKGAKSVYTPTTTLNQLSLETLRYLPTDETTTFIDFFLCGSLATDICVKKESQSPTILNSDKVSIANLSFNQIVNGVNPSIKISMTVSHKNPTNEPNNSSSVTLNSTVSLRNY